MGGVAVSRCRCGKQERDPLPLHYVLLALIQHGWSRLPSMATFKEAFPRCCLDSLGEIKRREVELGSHSWMVCLAAEFRSCVKVEVAVLGFPS